MHLLVALRKRYPCDEGHASGISTLMPMGTVLNVLHVLAAVFIIGPMAILHARVAGCAHHRALRQLDRRVRLQRRKQLRRFVSTRRPRAGQCTTVRHAFLPHSLRRELVAAGSR